MMSFTSGPEPVNILASSELITVVVIVWVTGMRTSEINGVSHHPQEGIPLVLRKRDVLQDFIKFSFQYIIQ